MLKISLSSLPRHPLLQVTPPTALCLWAAPSFTGTSIACMAASNYNRSKDTQIRYYSQSLHPQTSDHPCFARMSRLTTLLSEVVVEVPASQALSAYEDGCFHARHDASIFAGRQAVNSIHVHHQLLRNKRDGHFVFYEVEYSMLHPECQPAHRSCSY